MLSNHDTVETCGLRSGRGQVRSSYMAWTRQDPGTRRGYHHGNLREALIDAALNLIAQKGPAGFTFADAARSAGVSSAAPSRHLRDRGALKGVRECRAGLSEFCAQ